MVVFNFLHRKLIKKINKLETIENCLPVYFLWQHGIKRWDRFPNYFIGLKFSFNNSWFELLLPFLNKIKLIFYFNITANSSIYKLGMKRESNMSWKTYYFEFFIFSFASSAFFWSLKWQENLQVDFQEPGMSIFSLSEDNMYTSRNQHLCKSLLAI